MLAIQRRPDLYQAFIGTGQMVSPLATDRIFYRDTLAWARRTGRVGLAADLTDIGAPPYPSVLDYETALSYEYEVYPYDHTGNSEGEGGFSQNFFVPEHTLVDQVHLLAGFMDTFTALDPQLQEIALRLCLVSGTRHNLSTSSRPRFPRRRARPPGAAAATRLGERRFGYQASE